MKKLEETLRGRNIENDKLTLRNKLLEKELNDFKDRKTQGIYSLPREENINTVNNMDDRESLSKKGLVQRGEFKN